MLPEQPDPKLLPDIHLTFKELTPIDALVFDIETDSSYPTKGRILAIGLKNKDQTLIIRNQDEAIILKEFCERITRLSGNTILIGHNIMKFDLTFIKKRCEILSIECPFSYRIIKGTVLNRQVPGTGGKPNDFNRYDEIESKYVKIVDTMFLALLADSRKLFKNTQLKNLAIELKVRAEQRLELTPQEIVNCWITGDSRFEEYLTFDLEDALGIFNVLFPPYYEQLSFIPNLDAQQVVLAPTAGKIERLLKDYYPGEYPTEEPPTEYIGAYTEINPGIYIRVEKVDVASLYPSIMIAWQITTDKDTKKILPAYLKDMLKLRLEYKKTNKDRSDALKLLMNSAYGFFASRRAWNCPAAAAQVTSIGREILHMMIDKMNALGGAVIECDTDGIYYSCDRDIFAEIQAVLPKGIFIEHDPKEGFWPWGLFYKSKNYCIKELSESFIDKGLFHKRDVPIYKPEFLKTYAEHIIAKQDAEAYYNQMLQDLSTGVYPVEKLSVHAKIKSNSVSLVRYGERGTKITSYKGYDVRGKEDDVIAGPYNKKYYSKKLTELYDWVKKSVTPKEVI